MTTPPLHFIGVPRACRFCHGTGANVYGHAPCICNGTGVVIVARLADKVSGFEWVGSRPPTRR